MCYFLFKYSISVDQNNILLYLCLCSFSPGFPSCSLIWTKRMEQNTGTLQILYDTYDTTCATSMQSLTKHTQPETHTCIDVCSIILNRIDKSMSFCLFVFLFWTISVWTGEPGRVCTAIRNSVILYCQMWTTLSITWTHFKNNICLYLQRRELCTRHVSSYLESR